MSNILVGDDSHYMPFVPYADEEEFEIPFDHYQRRFHWFEWSNIRERDPDVELVVLETAGRLLSANHTLTAEDIDATNVLPLKLLPVQDKFLSPGHAGVLRSSTRRDFPPWPRNPSRVPTSSSIPRTTKDTFEGLMKCFCHNRNCIVGFCQLHVNEVPLSNPVNPTVSAEALLRTIEKECGSECCLRGPAAARSIPTQWSENDHQMLEIVLKYSPDTIPCDLAIICRKPCYEVHKYRERYFPPSTLLGRGAKRSSSTRSGNFHDYDSREFVPNDPCSHTGPCSPAFNCPCYQNGAHCSSACRCSRSCPRRLFCSCMKTRKGLACASDKCPCLKAKRECDPDLCVRCSCRDSEANVCQNAQIQRAKTKRTEVRPSDWGLGLFILEPAEKGELIVEYVGEVIFDETMISRNDVYRYSGRCYMFELNKAFTIDSAAAGNESRYINHSENPNCEASVLMVNGEHRIGLYASRSIEAGAEIFFNYGAIFFVSQEDAQKKFESEKKKPHERKERPADSSSFPHQYEDRSSDDDYRSESGAPASE